MAVWSVIVMAQEARAKSDTGQRVQKQGSCPLQPAKVLPNNKYKPSHCLAQWCPTTDPYAATVKGNNAGANDELFSFHPGGVNVLMGDGSVKFLKDSVSVIVLRGLVTLKGGEIVSADAY